MKKFILLFAVLLTVTSCSKTSYELYSAPELTAKPIQSEYFVGQAFNTEINIKQINKSQYLLSATIIAGDASMTVNGQEFSLQGQWLELSSAKEIATIIPKKVGALSIRFQIKSDDGTLSNIELLELDVTSEEFTATIAAPEQFSSTAKITLNTIQAGYDGVFQLSYSQIQGNGAISIGGVILREGEEFNISANTDITILYSPEAEGTHKIQLNVKHGDETFSEAVTMTAMSEVKVYCNLSSATITGAGAHELGETVMLTAKAPGYIVVGWYNHITGALLSTDENYSFILGKVSPKDIGVMLKSLIIITHDAPTGSSSKKTINVVSSMAVNDELNVILRYETPFMGGTPASSSGVFHDGTSSLKLSIGGEFRKAKMEFWLYPSLFTYSSDKHIALSKTTGTIYYLAFTSNEVVKSPGQIYNSYYTYDLK